MDAIKAVVEAARQIAASGRDPRTCSYTAIMTVAREIFRASKQSCLDKAVGLY
jgi:hypothetical protein